MAIADHFVQHMVLEEAQQLQLAVAQWSAKRLNRVFVESNSCRCHALGSEEAWEKARMDCKGLLLLSGCVTFESCLLVKKSAKSIYCVPESHRTVLIET